MTQKPCYSVYFFLIFPENHFQGFMYYFAREAL